MHVCVRTCTCAHIHALRAYIANNSNSWCLPTHTNNITQIHTHTIAIRARLETQEASIAASRAPSADDSLLGGDEQDQEGMVILCGCPRLRLRLRLRFRLRFQTHVRNCKMTVNREAVASVRAHMHVRTNLTCCSPTVSYYFVRIRTSCLCKSVPKSKNRDKMLCAVYVCMCIRGTLYVYVHS